MKLAVFDLDYTIWKPEMYQLWGPPKLVPVSSQKNLSPAILMEARTKQQGMILVDREGSPMRVFDGASFALSDINRMRRSGYEIMTGIASRTDEPSWARICMDHLVVADGTVLKDCFDDKLIEISKQSKSKHLERLQRATGIPFEQMCFFDNEYWNIEEVSRGLPVRCYYTPDGMTREAWNQAKADFGLADK